LIFAAITQSYLFFQNHFSGADILEKRVLALTNKLEEEKIRSYTSLYEANRIRQEVATLLPNRINDKSSYEVRKLASALQEQEVPQFKKPEDILNKGKELFNQSKYNAAIATFRMLIDRFSESPDAIEAYFLLSESYFQIQSSEDCIDTVEQMVTLFPESELTGFAMLRLALIFQQRQLDEDALQVVQTVKNHFAYHQELREQSEKLLRDLKR
jgi:TolA-binding protein